MTRFDHLGERLAREQDDLLEQSEAQTEVRERLADVDVRSLGLQRRQRRIAIGSGVGFLCAAAAVLVLVHPKPSLPASAPLALRIGSSDKLVPEGQFVEASASSDVALHFSDGSEFAVAEQGRARVVALTEHGAELLLESGSLHAQVRHREHSSWHIGAGPFGVHVTGTRFDVRWQPEQDAFQLQLIEGSVEITGCAFGDGYRVRAGQTVRASCHDEHLEVSSGPESAVHPQPSAAGSLKLDAEIKPEPSPAPRAAPEPAGAGGQTSLQSTMSTSRPRFEPDWQAFARKGHYVQALHAAQAQGLPALCQRTNLDQLSLLADVARYARDPSAEGMSLRLLRDRFHGTKRAAQAAFALGRLEFDSHGAYAEAAEWFRVYLREQPSGVLAREASGRLMEATERSGNAAAARELAGQYLHDYPEGPHTSLAHSLLD
jgi:hypothetical protein